MVKVLSETEACDTHLKRSEVRASAHLHQCIYQVAYSGNGLGYADDNSPNTQEPDEVKVCAVVRTERIATRGGRRSG
jgi:hypothetical protein